VLRRPAWAQDVAEEALFKNPYVVVARTGHPLSGSKVLGLRELSRYDWIMPGPLTPRQQAFRRLFADLPALPKISVETTSLQIHRDLLATTAHPDVDARSPTQRSRQTRGVAVPIVRIAPHGRPRHPDRLATDPDSPSFPESAANARSPPDSRHQC
jgi:hypothetical protein